MSCAQCAVRAQKSRPGFELERTTGQDFEGSPPADITLDLNLPSRAPVRSPRVLVRNTTDVPFRYICSLEYDVPGVGRRSMCTGLLVGPRTLLTAGHCVAKLDRMQVRVIPGRNGTLEPLPATRIDGKPVLPPGFRSGAATDYGIVHLVDPIGDKVGYWTLKSQPNPGDPVGTSLLASGVLPLTAGQLQVNLSGYPGDKPDDAKYFCRDPKEPPDRCRQSLVTDQRRSALCGTFQYRVYDLTTRLTGGILHYRDETCPGQVGGPVWVRRSPDMGGRVLVGIHVGGNHQANFGVFITPAVRSFIVANIL
jgi:V8-like Glu-specific endopeptidase